MLPSSLRNEKIQVQELESDLLQQMLSIQWREECEFKRQIVGLQTFRSGGGAEGW